MARRGRVLTQPAHPLTRALAEAVDAARAQDLPAYDAAVARLATLDPPRVAIVTGAVVRALLEQLHPGGLTGQDVGDLLRRCVAPWLPDLDPGVLLVVVTGALGLLDADDQPAALSPLQVLRHAPVLVAVLVAAAGGPVGPWLDAALAELRRAETVELP